MTIRLDYAGRRSLTTCIRDLRGELAEAVTAEFLERHPDWVDRYGDLARVRGVEDALFHLDFLAGAVESGSPEAFADYGRWTAGMLAARDIAPRFLAENLRQIRAALEPHFDAADFAFVREYLDAGIDAVREVGDVRSAGDPGSGTSSESEGRLSDEGARDDARSRAAEPGRDLDLSCSLYVQAILQGDKRAAVRVVDEALRFHPVTAVYRGIVEAAQVEVGNRWALNRISVAREHMATAVSQYVLGELYSRLPVPEKIIGRALITGVEGERHQLGANMVADLLEAEGWSVRFLGTQMPHRDIVQVTEEHEADAVGISATMLFNVPSVSRLIRDLRAVGGKDLRIVLGGRAFRSSPHLWRELGADAAGGDLDSALTAFRPFGR